MSYADTIYAGTYFTGTVNEDKWTAILPADQAKLLESASSYIDVGFKFSGTQTDEVLAFPRSGCVNSCNGYAYADTEVPVLVQNANCEIALQMNEDDSLSAGGLNSFDANVTKEKVDTLEVEYKDSSSSVLSPEPYGYTWLQCILEQIGTTSSFRFVKG